MSHVPIASIMYHTIGVPNKNWTWSFLTTPWQNFEGVLQWLQRMKYRTVFLDEYKELVLTGRILKERAIALTFDDGYLDNWTHAAPLLEQYNACGTVFVSGEFINPSLQLRPQWQGKEHEHPYSDGFLTMGEIQALDKSKILDVQSHCMSHTWFPCSPKIVDFRHPGDAYHWMDWNEQPQCKWMHNQPPSRPETWGEPVYEHQKSLAGQRYFPQAAVGHALKAHVAKEGREFFSRPQWKEELFALAHTIQQDMPEGHYESEEAFAVRVEYELGQSSRLLSTSLNKKVPWLCWPGGGYSQETFTTAAKYYTGSTLASGSVGTTAQGMDEQGCFRFRRFGALTAGQGATFRYQRPLNTCLYAEERRTGSSLYHLVRGGLSRLNEWNII